jgi:hypothetical protein
MHLHSKHAVRNQTFPQFWDAQKGFWCSTCWCPRQRRRPGAPSGSCDTCGLRCSPAQPPRCVSSPCASWSARQVLSLSQQRWCRPGVPPPCHGRQHGLPKLTLAFKFCTSVRKSIACAAEVLGAGRAEVGSGGGCASLIESSSMASTRARDSLCVLKQRQVSVRAHRRGCGPRKPQ